MPIRGALEYRPVFNFGIADAKTFIEFCIKKLTTFNPIFTNFRNKRYYSLKFQESQGAAIFGWSASVA
ncbi:hypothetical protein A1355_15770 [Methylomonas koyamae]|uniref:Uncharacterized protein n=1 Tax=Methylomonas koyamae TaxID=702114 RepID=A0A177N0R2_9GAMM|nr:hypothetical protein A1355_15770 [Methylomonas koyamae]